MWKFFNALYVRLFGQAVPPSVQPTPPIRPDQVRLDPDEEDDQDLRALIAHTFNTGKTTAGNRRPDGTLEIRELDTGAGP